MLPRFLSSSHTVSDLMDFVLVSLDGWGYSISRFALCSNFPKRIISNDAPPEELGATLKDSGLENAALFVRDMDA